MSVNYLAKYYSPPEPDNNKEESLSGPFEVTDLPVWMTDEDGNRVEARFTGEIFVIIEK